MYLGVSGGWLTSSLGRIRVGWEDILDWLAEGKKNPTCCLIGSNKNCDGNRNLQVPRNGGWLRKRAWTNSVTYNDQRRGQEYNTISPVVMDHLQHQLETFHCVLLSFLTLRSLTLSVIQWGGGAGGGTSPVALSFLTMRRLTLPVIQWGGGAGGNLVQERFRSLDSAIVLASTQPRCSHQALWFVSSSLLSARNNAASS